MNDVPTRAQWLARRCRDVRAVRRLTPDEASTLVTALDGWRIEDDALARDYRFRDDLRATAFVSAIGWFAHLADHHPELRVAYDRCTVRWTTHSVGGISEKDFVCAARCDEIFDPTGA